MKKKQAENVREFDIREKLGYRKGEAKGITLIALVITTIFSYDQNVKSSNNKGFLLQTI